MVERTEEASAPVIEERRGEVGGIGAYWRAAPATDGGLPILYVHGNPALSDGWLPFLERTGGVAPDMPGFGRTDKPATRSYDPHEMADWLESLLAREAIDRFRLVVHDWGAGFGMVLAQRMPERVERLVVIDGVPLSAQYRWHWIGRVWRRRGLGEAFIGAMVAPLVKPVVSYQRLPGARAYRDLIARVWPHFDQGTQRAVLRLYRWADPDRLAAAGAGLGKLTCPALIVWGERDAYIDPRFARVWADALGGDAQVVTLPNAGHWCWLDDPSVVDRVADFLLA